MAERRTPLAQILVLFLAIGVVLAVLWLSRPREKILAFIATHEGNPEIYTLNLTTGVQTRLTVNDANDSHITWSPDGRQMAFSSNRDGQTDIYVMNADGSNQHRLTWEGAEWPHWSPDGTQIAFTGYLEDKAEIYVMNADGSNPRRLTNNDLRENGVTWSPDSKRLAFEGSAYGAEKALYVIDVNGNNVSALSPTQVTTGSMSPAWSPDGRYIIYKYHGQIHAVDVNTASSWPLAFYGDQGTPSWSPDGKRFTFIYQHGIPLEVAVVNLDGSNLKSLTRSRDNPINGNPVWSPDGTQIAFVSRQAQQWNLFLMNTDGSNIRQLTFNTSGGIGMLAWRP